MKSILFLLAMGVIGTVPALEFEDYANHIKYSVERFMILDPTMKGKTCLVDVSLSRTGHVTRVGMGEGDPAVCRAGRAAILKVGHFPLPDNYKMAQDFLEFNINFEPSI